MSSASEPLEPTPPPTPEDAPETSMPAGGPMDNGLPGQALSTLVFTCAAHGEEQAVEYYDPRNPPRCTHGDLMVRGPR